MMVYQKRNVEEEERTKIGRHGRSSGEFQQAVCWPDFNAALQSPSKCKPNNGSGEFSQFNPSNYIPQDAKHPMILQKI